MVFSIDGIKRNLENFQKTTTGEFLGRMVVTMRANPLPILLVSGVFCALAMLYRSYGNSKPSAPDGYTLENNGVLYKLSFEGTKGKKRQVQQATELRTWDTIEEPKHSVIQKDFFVQIEIEMLGFQVPVYGVDIVINEQFISFAAQGLFRETVHKTRGYILTKNWKELFPNISQDDMQFKIGQASTSFDAGIFRIKFPNF